MGIIKAYASLVIGLALGFTITIYFHLNVVWSGITGLVSMVVVLWAEKKIRAYIADREWREALKRNR